MVITFGQLIVQSAEWVPIYISDILIEFAFGVAGIDRDVMSLFNDFVKQNTNQVKRKNPAIE